MIKVSILIPTYNCKTFLGKAIQSALAQTIQDYEILVVDDGSTDNTKELVQTLIDQHPNKIRYIYQENKGLAVARNTGLKHAQGEFIALLDADDAWYPNHLELELKVIQTDPKIGLVHANVTKISETDEILTIPVRQSRFLSGMIFDNLFLRKADILCPTALFRKICVDELGGFDENLTRLGCEDRELWLRISQKYIISYIDEPLAYYRIRKNSMSRNIEKMLKARLYVVDKFNKINFNKNLKNLALSKIYRELGDVSLCEYNFPVARSYYLQSIALSPLSVWTWINLTKALLKVKTNKVYY